MSNTIGSNVLISEKARVVNSTMKDYSRIKDYAEMTESELGEYSYTSQFSIVNKSIIGKFCSIAHGAYVGLWEHNLFVTTHSLYLYETSGYFVKGYKNYEKDSISTIVGNDVWIGANSVVLKGVKISDGAVIGAGAIVTKDIPSYAIAAGNPAEVVRYRFAREDIEYLLKIRWWDKPREIIQEMVDENVFYSLEKLKVFFQEIS